MQPARQTLHRHLARARARLKVQLLFFAPEPSKATWAMFLHSRYPGQPQHILFLTLVKEGIVSRQDYNSPNTAILPKVIHDLYAAPLNRVTSPDPFTFNDPCQPTTLACHLSHMLPCANVLSLPSARSPKHRLRDVANCPLF